MTLNSLFNSGLSDKIVFQGGTAIRWLFNGGRFSEDLDFVTSLSPERTDGLVRKVWRKIREDSFLFVGDPSRMNVDDTLELNRISFKGGLTTAVLRQPIGRNAIRLKLEFHHVQSLEAVDMEQSFLAGEPPVAAFVAKYALPRPTALVVHESAKGIMADKIIAIRRRPAIKGRDFWDIWFLGKVVGVGVDQTILARHFTLYSGRDARSAAYTPGRDGWPEEVELEQAIIRDLRRFIPPADLDHWRRENFTVMIQAVKTVLEETRHVMASLR